MLLLKTGASSSWNDQVKLVVWLPSDVGGGEADAYHLSIGAQEFVGARRVGQQTERSRKGAGRGGRPRALVPTVSTMLLVFTPVSSRKPRLEGVLRG